MGATYREMQTLIKSANLFRSDWINNSFDLLVTEVIEPEDISRIDQEIKKTGSGAFKSETEYSNFLINYVKYTQ